jgi:hypothetical protein
MDPRLIAVLEKAVRQFPNSTHLRAKQETLAEFPEVRQFAAYYELEVVEDSGTDWFVLTEGT